MLDNIISAFDKLRFPLGLVTGAFLILTGNLLKKQLESTISNLLAKFPAHFTKVFTYRTWQHKYRQATVNEHKFVRLVGLQQQFEVSPPKLEDVYVNLELQSPSSRSTEQSLTPAFTLHDTFPLHIALTKFKQIAILGDPGSGKTTLLEHIVAIHSNSKHSKTSTLLPIYIPLRRCILDGRSFVDELTGQNNGIIPPSLLSTYPNGFFESRLESGACILLFDGLDEVLDENRHVAAAHLVESCAVLYQKCQIVLTSRIAGWRNLIGLGFTRFVIRELSLKEIDRLVTQWYQAVLTDKARAQVISFTDEIEAATQKQASEMAKRIFGIINNNDRLKEIATTPLILSIICLVYYIRHDLPNKRSQLYEECSKVLLKEWDEMDKHLSGQYRLSYDQKKELLKSIAAGLFKYGISEIPKNELKVSLQTYLKTIQSESQTDDILRHIQERSGLIVEKAIGKYGFSHLTFQEYFTALSLLDTPDGLLMLLDKLERGESTEIALLYAGAAEKADELIQKLLSHYRNKKTFDVLILCGQAIAESQQLSSILKSEVIKELTFVFDNVLDYDILPRIQNVLSRLGVERNIVRKFGDYNIISELGRGGFATTYRAWDNQINRDVALKVYSSGTGLFLDNIGNEVTKLRELIHPSLVQTLDVGTKKDQLFVSMEFINGLSLNVVFSYLVNAYVKNRQIPISYPLPILFKKEEGIVESWLLPSLGSFEYFMLIQRISENIVEGVSALHKAGIRHGDLKPSNILLYQDGQNIKAKIADYCIDSVVANQKLSRTMYSITSIHVYTEGFAAPELKSFGNRPSAESDVFSLGMLICELFLLPYPQTSNRINYALPIIEELASGNEVYSLLIKTNLQRVFQKATAARAEERFRSVLDFWDEVKKCTAFLKDKTTK